MTARLAVSPAALAAALLPGLRPGAGHPSDGPTPRRVYLAGRDGPVPAPGRGRRGWLPCADGWYLAGPYVGWYRAARSSLARPTQTYHPRGLVPTE